MTTAEIFDATTSGIDVHTEQLLAHHRHLIAQIEVQLATIHHAMARISALRGSRLRIAGQMSSEEQPQTESRLEAELTAIDEQIETQVRTSHDMANTIVRIQAVAARLRAAAAGIGAEGDPVAWIDERQ